MNVYRLAVLLFLISLSFHNSFARDDIDSTLQRHIFQFGLKPLQKSTDFNAQKIELGQKLFHETALSGNNNISCASCHHPMTLTHDRLPLALGEGSIGMEANGQHRMQGSSVVIARNSPALFNLDSLRTASLFWDGRVRFFGDERGIESPEPRLNPRDPVLGAIAKSLTNSASVQALFPMVNNDEMMGKKGTNEIANSPDRATAWSRLVDRLLKSDTYVQLFKKAFPNESTIHIGHVAEALSEFERQRFFAADTPYDRYLKGNLNALTPIQKKGMDVFFGKGKCGNCHSGPQLSDFDFHNVGTPQIGPNRNDLGRASINEDGTVYGFRTPPLRNVALTAPYMHNGAFQNLAQVIEHYDDVEASLKGYRYLRPNQNYNRPLQSHDHAFDATRLSTLSGRLTPELHFLEDEEKALLEFLRGALTDVRFADLDPPGANHTFIRLDVNANGFQKAVASMDPASSSIIHETNSHFDLFQNGGYYLREMEDPTSYQLRQHNGKTTLITKVFPTHRSEVLEGITLNASFGIASATDWDESISAPILGATTDLFALLYSDQFQKIPATAQGILKGFSKAPQSFLDWLSEAANLESSELHFAPTSMNTKTGRSTTEVLDAHPTEIRALMNSVRDETGKPQTTYSIEFSTEQVLLKDRHAWLGGIREVLRSMEIEAEDTGTTPLRPSFLTEKVLREQCGEQYENCLSGTSLTSL